MPKKLLVRCLHGATGVALATCATGASAIDFQIGEDILKIDNLISIGASWRMQNRDPSLIGKSSLYALENPQSGAADDPSRVGLCFTRTSQDVNTPPDSDLDAGNNTYTDGVITRGCTASSPTGSATTTPSPENIAYVGRPGSFSPNGDNGDLNFDKGDLVHAVAKLTTDLSFSKWDYNLFVRGVFLFDANYTDFTEFHPDTTMQAAESQLPDGAESLVGMDFDLLDYSIGHVFSPADHDVSVKLGNQVLNWGESSLLALNSLNTINPPDARRLNMPGLDLKEAFQPLGMLTLDTQIIDNVSVQTFYTYDWKPIVVDPVGTFFSQSDTLGPAGEYAMLSFAKQPEDPGFLTDDPKYPAGKRGYYRPIDTCADGVAPCTDSLGLLGSTASRTVYRDHNEEKNREPDGGDYGAAVKLFLESINNGTELAFYYANYDSRLPVVSSFAAHRTCIDSAADMAPGVGACGYMGPGQPTTGAEDPVPVDTMRLFVEYPEDIKLYGVSFNTTVGDYALSGEYAFRTNLPIQIDTVDLTYTSLQPAFDDQDVNLGVVTIPGRQSAFPSYLNRYRGLPCTSDADCIQPGQYIAGFERFKVGQANLTVLRLIGGDNPLGASQMTVLMEMGMQKVFDMPAIGELQLEGSGSDTHISSGADGSQGLDPPGVAGNSGGNRRRNNGLMQNPTANTDYEGYGTSESYGYRLLNLNRWDSALFGANLETLAIVRHDVKGTSPGIATNFSDNRRQFNFGLRFDYLSQWNGEVRYTWFMGKHDGQRDRDNVFVTLGYQF
jgi:hypothetical protein